MEMLDKGSQGESIAEQHTKKKGNSKALVNRIYDMTFKINVLAFMANYIV